MLRLEVLAAQPRACRSLTGHSPAEIEALYQAFAPAYQRPRGAARTTRRERRRRQPPRPDKVEIKGPVEKQLIQLACSDPPPGRCRWTLQLLADRLLTLHCVESVSHEAVRRALKKTTSSRGR
jgi:hypothetical protein